MRLIKFQYEDSENIDTTKNYLIISCKIAKTNVDYDTKRSCKIKRIYI